MDASEPQDTFADLRAFFTIGFQELWLGKHGIPREYLFGRLVETCMEKRLGLMAITSEDDKMIESSSEDRLGYLMKISHEQPHSNIYTRERLDENLLRVTREEDGRTLLILNSETIHAPPGANWQGLKLQVVGSNRLEKNYPWLEDTAKICNDKGLLTFLTGISSEKITEHHLEKAAQSCYGIITHDANNTFYPWMQNIPMIGKDIQKYMVGSNIAATHLARDLNKPEIAVSSAHFPQEIGNASILIPRMYLAPEKVRGYSCLLTCIKHTLDERAHILVKGYNRMWDVCKFGNLINTYGNDPNRFAGDGESSYNEEETSTDASLNNLSRLNRRPFF